MDQFLQLKKKYWREHKMTDTDFATQNLKSQKFCTNNCIHNDISKGKSNLDHKNPIPSLKAYNN